MYFPLLLRGRGLWMMPVCPKGLSSLQLTNQRREKNSRGWDSHSNRNLALRKGREKKKHANTKIMRASFLFVDLLTLWHCNWIIIIIAVNISNKPYCFLKKAEIFSRNLKKVSSNVYKILKFSSYFFKPLSVFEKFLIYSRCTSIYEFECVINFRVVWSKAVRSQLYWK